MNHTMATVPQQVEKALDGRTQRWLALQLRIPETDLSRKMNGRSFFSEQEIKLINKLLKSKIKLA